ncbi:class Ib ribonucleoside-diphosphate reductase assembly flavoprotein NrdI [Halomonas sp. ISL-60]|uniref:Protein NrdI n=1 Tax=Vreelandella titanicae TaxID=664683 RepID=A0A558J5S9_9GAMM|nr:MULTISPECIES: class Ib ribonucleoside-diphosphate reductase assembly flavoprotein NrdI [Halomonas]MBR9903140.1 class Ib ribonucleoside-diphosphate reductase assembly flavoprotein NrdI [Gammaproteobacteria bacterium]MBT2774580.1 class Ib ribonucleoside-diphosphate reductase assembly flavoprotein NrdI [Halomonas sp. ISL-60]MBT2802591.1 class Ib ribonucleoside-diphosphate reductase assembly flavoprotein NrdI [Halomonas sp. ISL-56]TVU88985.1 class Ib ribonucleoside-diphosphate reductase assembly
MLASCTSAPAAGSLVYFSTKSGNTHRFVEKLGFAAKRLPLNRDEPVPRVTQPYILITPTYGGGSEQGAVPKQVIHFLNDTHNRSLLRGVIAAGNTNFGEAYGLAGRIIAKKCNVPLLYRFELFGTDDDVANVRKGVEEFWKRQA